MTVLLPGVTLRGDRPVPPVTSDCPDCGKLRRPRLTTRGVFVWSCPTHACILRAIDDERAGRSELVEAQLAFVEAA